jgi:hypothetical protein
MKLYEVKKSEKFPDGEARIYTLDEANELHIGFVPYRNWRTAEYGDYVETVDGYVTPIIKRNNHPSTGHIKTPTGCFHTNRGGTIFDTSEFYNRNSFTRKSRWNGNSPKLTKNQEVFFQVFTHTFDLHLATKSAYRNLGFPSDIISMAQEIINSKLFKEYMNKFKDKFEAAGITEEYLIERLKHSIDHASPTAAPVLLKMGAAGIGSCEMFGEELVPKDRQLPVRGAFHQIEEAKVVDNDEEFGAIED